MQKLTAIILASCDIGEFDRIYTMYCRETGLTKVVGRGVRKQTAKLAGHLEPGTLAEVYVARSRGMGQATSAIALENFPRVKNDFEILDEILKIFRFFTRNFSEEEKDEKIFDLLNDFLELLEHSKSSTPGSIAVEAFWWKLFDFLGHRPETTKCVRCGEKLREEGRKFFSAERGGIACEKCSAEDGGLYISSNQIKFLRLVFANPLKKILRLKIDKREISELMKIRLIFYNSIFGI